MILVDAHRRHDWLLQAVEQRLREELAVLHVTINEEKSRMVDLAHGETFSFLGFDFRRVKSRQRGLAPVVHAEAEEADGAPAQVEGDIPALRVPTGGSGDRPDQPDPAGMGALLCRGRLPPMLWLYQRLGGKEGAAASDACTESQGLRLEEVE